MENLPLSLSLAFGVTTGFTVWVFYKAAHYRWGSLLGLLLWLLLQGALALGGFYTITSSFPPRLGLLLGPPLLVLALLFFTTSGRKFLDGLRIETLMLLHLVRIPVELVLFGLYLHQAVPKLMTFEGRNWDILAGLTAPIIYYLAFVTKQMGSKSLLLWNLICLGSLLNIVMNAVLSAPSAFQQFAFDQPNVALLHFPFVFLPSCVVPLVLLAHMVAIRQLTAKSEQDTVNRSAAF